MNVLVIGSAGLIGSCVVNALVNPGHAVVGLHNFNEYYPVTLYASAKKASKWMAHANIEKTKSKLGCHPATNLQAGLERFVSWHRAWSDKEEGQE